MGWMWCLLCCVLRLLFRFEMVTCIGSDLVAVGCLFFEASVACAILEAMSGCLEFSVSCIGVGPGGSC